MNTKKSFQEHREMAESHSKNAIKLQSAIFVALSLLNCNGRNLNETICNSFRKGNAEDFLKAVQEAVQYFDYQNWISALKEDDSGIVYAENYNNKITNVSIGFGK